jgi:hypothetical protein
MSDHNWVLENLESYSAGGLDAQERERLEAHLPGCASCSQALQDIRASDQELESLFAPVRPKPGFEDRMISTLRTASTKNGFRMPMIGWIGASAAAAVMVGVVGASMERVVQLGSLLPESDRITARNNLQQIGSAIHNIHDDSGSTIGDLGARIQESSTPMLGDIDYDGTVDKMAEVLSEKQLSELQNGELASALRKAKQRATADFYAAPYAQQRLRTPEAGRPVTDGTSNTMSVRESIALSPDGRNLASGKEGGVKIWDLNSPAPATQPAPGTANSEAPVELKMRAPKEVNAPAQLYTYRNDQPAATTPAAAGAAPPAGAGWGYGPGGMGGGGAGGMGGRMSAPAGGPGGGGGKGEGKSNTDYYRPGEQAAKELEKFKEEKKDKKPEGGQEAKPITEAGDDKSEKRVGNISIVGTTVTKENVVQAPKPGSETPAAMRKIIIRTGDIEFEVDSFDSAVATVTLLVNKLPGAFVATVNSEKLPNGKVRGSLVVRTPPEHLDTLVLDLRKELGKNGELKGQKIGSQDVTKQYTDMESRLKAARAMENRLLEIIKSGKGEIKDLLVAEKELGVWRTKIEEYEGEKRYYDNQVALSTLTISLAEKEIRSPFALIETERVQMGVEVEDVIKAQQAVLKAIDDAKGRVTKSELKQHAADQLSATINFEVAPDKAGALRDRIEQIGRRTRLDVDRLQETEGGSGDPNRVSSRVASEIKTRRKDTQFFLNLYNVANVAPRETVSLNLACVDTEDTYKKILARVEKATGRVVSSNLNRQRNDQTTGLVQFEVKSADAEAVLMDVRELGEVMRLQTTENPDVQNATRSKRGFIVQLFALGTVAPRETATIQLASKDVPAGYRTLLDAINKAKGRVLNSQLNEQDKQNITANLDFEIRRADEAAIAKAMSDVGDTYSRTVARAQDSDTVVDSKVRYTVTLINQARIPPRETVTLGIEVNDVDKTAADLAAHVGTVNGRTVEQHVARERSGRMTAKLIYDVPLASARDLVEKFSKAGIVRVQQFTRNQQVPESDLAIARLDVTLSNSPLIVPSDEGFGTELRKGLATSVKVLSLSLSWLLFGLMVILPWVLVVYAIYRLVVRLRGRPSPA